MIEVITLATGKSRYCDNMRQAVTAWEEKDREHIWNEYKHHGCGWYAGVYFREISAVKVSAIKQIDYAENAGMRASEGEYA